MKWFLFAACALALQGCTGLFEQRVIVARPAVPVILAEDMADVRVLVRVDETHWTVAYCNLYAGELVMADPLDYPAELVNQHAEAIAKAQGFHPVK